MIAKWLFLLLAGTFSGISIAFMSVSFATENWVGISLKYLRKRIISYSFRS
jgi:hypothetical protein